VERRFTGYTVAAANTRYYGGGMQVAPTADPEDGLLEVVFIGDTSKLRFLGNLPKVFSGKHVEVEGVQTFSAREVEIVADRPFAVYADGDPIADLPARARVIPGVLRVLVPR
jgi:diacylglycerol kinase family enzyme